MSEQTDIDSSEPIAPIEHPAPAPRRRFDRTRRLAASGISGLRLLARLGTWLGAPLVRGTLKRLPLPGFGPKTVALTPPIPVVPHVVSALAVEVSILGIDGKGPVYSVIARLKALDSAGHQHQSSAQAVQIAFQEQFAARGETVTDVTTQAIIPALDDVQAWFAYTRVTKQRGRRL